MSIEINNETSYVVDEKEFSDLARYVFEQMRVHPQTELAIMFVDPAVIEELHIKWMDLPGPTDVLSFPMDELRPTPIGQDPQPGLLGDIVICPDVAVEQAKKAGHSPVEEMLLLATHGILHLLGYDHVEPEEEKVMFGLQRNLILTFLAQRPAAGS